MVGHREIARAALDGSQPVPVGHRTPMSQVHIRVLLGQLSLDGVDLDMLTVQRAVGGFEAELLELVPDERIVFRWGFVGPDRDAGPAFDSLLTVTLHEAPGGGTRLILVHERLDELAAAMPDVAKQVGTGWDSVLDQMAVVVKA
jgi:uncharacterized protein YndB with AHSA1/START domain